MTDRFPDDRAERAFTDAFAERAAEHDFAPLDPDALKAGGGPSASGTRAVEERKAGPRRPWLYAAAAAVALVLVVPVAGLLVGRPGSQTLTGAPAAPAPANAPRPDAGRGAGPAAAPEAAPPRDTGFTAPDGQRWESMLDVAVLVPQEWGYGFAPGSDWCAADGYARPEEPFVQRNPLSQVTRSILCPEPVPDGLRQVHLTWRHAEPGDVAGVVPAGGWVRVNRPVGSAFLTVEAPADQLALAESILATARAGQVDPRGCPVREAGASPTDGGLAGFGGVSAAVVCQYVVDAARPGADLAGSYALDEAQAVALAESILARPVSPERAGEPGRCTHGEVLLVRFVGHTDDVRSVRLVTGVGCGPFALDDGVALREPSRATCADLLTGPLWQAAFDERTSAACSPR